MIFKTGNTFLTSTKKGNMKKIIFILLTVVLSACTNMEALEPLNLNEKQRTFQYDYKIKDTPKKVLFKRARNYIATVFGDSKSVIRVSDQESGKILGKGLVEWEYYVLSPGTGLMCHNQYDLKFAAKDNKARLQLILINQAPALSACDTFHTPNKAGFQVIKNDFNIIHLGMKTALSKKDSLDDF